MKAAVINKYGEPEVIEIIDLPVPEPDKNQVLIKNYYAGVNPVECKTRRGFHKYILGSHFPIILGYDVSGEIIKKGEEAVNFNIGDRVYGRSDVKYGRTYAQYSVVSENSIAIIPQNIDYKIAAAIPLASLTVLQALRDKGKIRAGNNVLIIGAAGGVGHFAVQLVKFFKARCYAVSSERHLEFINELAPDEYIDYTKTDFKKLDQKFDIIFDTIGNESYLSCRHLLKRKGIYITTLPRPKVLVHKIISLFFPGKARTLLMKANRADLEYISSLIKRNLIKTKIDRVFNLSDAANAHKYLEKGHTEGKIVIEIPQNE